MVPNGILIAMDTRLGRYLRRRNKFSVIRKQAAASLWLLHLWQNLKCWQPRVLVGYPSQTSENSVDAKPAERCGERMHHMNGDYACGKVRGHSDGHAEFLDYPFVAPAPSTVTGILDRLEAVLAGVTSLPWTTYSMGFVRDSNSYTFAHFDDDQNAELAVDAVTALPALLALARAAEAAQWAMEKDHDYFCPLCYAMREEGHAESCEFQALARLHGAERSDYGLPRRRPRRKPYAADMQRAVKRRLRELASRTSEIKPETITALSAKLLEHLKRLESLDAFQLCHHHLYSDDILYDPAENRTTLIDCGGLQFSRAARDLAAIRLMPWMTPEAWQEFSATYFEKSKESRSLEYEREGPFFEIFIWLSRARNTILRAPKSQPVPFKSPAETLTKSKLQEFAGS